MKKSRFTESQIFSILKEVDAGVKVEAVCRKHGTSNATHYNWKARYGGMDTSELRRKPIISGPWILCTIVCIAANASAR
jgi:putative transposase